MSCTAPKKVEISEEATTTAKPKYSLAQWSFNRELFAGTMTTQDYIRKAGELDFDGVEYVSQFFQDKVEDFEYLNDLKKTAEQADVKSLLIMVDRAGDLGASDVALRNAAVEAHKKWVVAAKHLGCTTIRVNAHGDGTYEEQKMTCMDGIGRLAIFAKELQMDVIIENHGGASSRGDWLADLVKSINMDNVGTLPDFDNWCYKTKDGGNWGECVERYDRLKGLRELMPYAKALSVKTFDFDTDGNETTMDYNTLFQIVQASGYDGYLGIEFEGHDLDAVDGIKKTVALVEKVWQ